MSNDKKPIIQFENYYDGSMMRRCPHCGELKPIEDFGMRDMGDGTIRNQSWCKDCRSYK